MKGFEDAETANDNPVGFLTTRNCVNVLFCLQRDDNSSVSRADMGGIG